MRRRVPNGVGWACQAIRAASRILSRDNPDACHRRRYRSWRRKGAVDPALNVETQSTLFRFEIADVLANENVVIDFQRDCVFQMRAEGKNIFRLPVLNFGSNRDGKRRIAASATQDHLTIANDAHN